jgi:hypothetical protein
VSPEQRFEGQIAGLGSTSGVRVVVGWWRHSPLGEFADVMVEDAGGHRVLLAPDGRVAELLEQTYDFDEVVTGPVQVFSRGRTTRVHSRGLDLGFTVGRRTVLGGLLQFVPRRLATSARWLTLIDPVARMILTGVRTKGSARSGSTEFYGAYGLRRIDSLFGTWRGRDLGTLARVEPPVHFGFGSTPRQPMVTDLVTIIRGTS